MPCWGQSSRIAIALCIADTGVRRSFILSYRRSHLSLARALPIRMHAGVHTLVLPSPITLELMLVYALEPSSCTADMDARRSSHSRAAVQCQSTRSYSQQYHPIDDIHHVVSAILTNGEDHICPLTTVSAPSSPTINISVF